MNSSAHGKLLGIQFCRGIAAVLVVLYHAGRMLALPQYAGHVALGGVFNFGNAGVDFFFVLSGFIIFFVHEKDIGQTQRLPAYIWSRVTRIYPIYWLVTAIVLCLILMRPARNSARSGIRDLLVPASAANPGPGTWCGLDAGPRNAVLLRVCDRHRFAGSRHFDSTGVARPFDDRRIFHVRWNRWRGGFALSSPVRDGCCSRLCRPVRVRDVGLCDHRCWNCRLFRAGFGIDCQSRTFILPSSAAASLV